jgi:hypothetical protein
MQDRILMIIPTRERNQKHLELIESWRQTKSEQTDLLFIIDDNDVYERVQDPHIFYRSIPRIRMIPSLNYGAFENCFEYKYIGFMGDDHRFKTENWDSTILEDRKDQDMWIAYGNDLLQGEALPTSVLMTSNIIQKLGYMVPLNFIHLHADTFWITLGKHLSILKYYPDIIIEHMHFTAGKSEKDALYAQVNEEYMYKRDGEAFSIYMAHNFESDIKKLTQK